jgi:crotonobetainyl-CoA:carnitine CoA-transferase CaiB-like acyl-CoA transferase
MAGALEGVRILDLATMVAGPVATMMLADQGADVIKVESPTGDLMRHFSRGRNGINASFLTCNRNKRSIAVDLKSADGLAIVSRLIASAAVLVHNFRPGVAERMGLSEEAVRAIRRDIIYVSITGYGTKGPYARQRAYDPIIQAMSGLTDIQRDRDTQRPRMVRTIIADYTTAVTAAQAITAALFARERTGVGQHIQLSMLGTMIAYMWPEAMPSLTFVGNETDPSDGEIGPDLVFATQDRYVTVAALSDEEWSGLCRALDREDLINDPRFKTARDRSVNAVERRSITSAELEKWRASEILRRLLANDVPCAPVVSRFELLQDEQVRANQGLQEFDTASLGKVRMPRAAAQFDRTPTEVRKMAPQLGEDSASILAELGYDANEITRFQQSRVVYQQSGGAVPQEV